MSPITAPLVLDLLEWVARRPRSYADGTEAWRTSCPRLDVWEEAVDRGLVARDEPVRVTQLGRHLLAEHGRGATPPG
ncbi:hypothetical protein J8J14_04915 [Roseomonas sp. SSH11]|uniref:Uncharacterized protein n=1 Tax=Pararoseomonas baculiformis TaxID=2820812 RepID=A0ABS4AAT3_9PROT|nr:hypothetical protein [Pararoseomonas baculiformis]MBP0444112.1 hypothetical protein [Pararoseomonas baculiformis]